MASKKALSKQPDQGGGGKRRRSNNKDQEEQACNAQRLAKGKRAAKKAKLKKLAKKKRSDEEGEEMEEEEEEPCPKRKRAKQNNNGVDPTLMAKLAHLRAEIQQMEERNANSMVGTSASGTHQAPIVTGAPVFDNSDDDTPPPPDQIAVPETLTGMDTKRLQVLLGLKNNAAGWLALWGTIRDLMSQAGLRNDKKWKYQDKTTLSQLYNLVKKHYPQFERFVHNWGAEWLVQKAFGQCRGHWLCKNGGSKGKGATATATACQAHSR
ncbi:hypothetical protein FRC12_016054 [Ceratobasidium sp. 428]|nr:hypothetical protein FRC12_016054 [Ceratobasidium sp. 428]